MTTGKNKLTRYKVIVLTLRPRKGPPPKDEDVMVKDHDVFFGYSHPKLEIDQFFDLWANDERHLDPRNYVTFGRIIRVEDADHGPGVVMVTRMGRFYVEGRA